MGTNADVEIVGTDGSDDIDGGAGADVLLGSGGGDEPDGDEEYDVVSGGAGDDLIISENPDAVDGGEASTGRRSTERAARSA